MPALTTLATTTLLAPVTVSDSCISLSSTSGITPGVRLYIDRELMTVLRADPNGTYVSRGHGGTATSAHGTSATVTIGRADQFYMDNPVGVPPVPPLVTPWVNVITGEQWIAQGDETGGQVTDRYWAKLNTSRQVGALGVRQSTIDPTSAT